eukprot:CAMPEP_0176048462 /NCGR_PEP_ID=MMETSP0120_2-20121206/24074_1 /TAXON_ID=160619 /ORGANISM="Kryptoperidinium foliaceum, Strain CCMP 1326" /LENGTH=338 /DNA_ID=CAMNT_0017381881 /DNA_START=62 /DNA_END=1076 /DNA_ORIENTATION=+
MARCALRRWFAALAIFPALLGGRRVAPLKHGAIARRSPDWQRLLVSATLLFAVDGADWRLARGDEDLFHILDEDRDLRVAWGEYMVGAHLRVKSLLAEGWLKDAERAAAFEVYQRIFGAADIDGDGYLCETELHYSEHLAIFAPKSLTDGWRQEATFAAKEAKMFFDALDETGQGSIDLETFRRAAEESVIAWGWNARRLEDEFISEAVDAIFDSVDVTGDGRLNWKELQLGGHFVLEFARHKIGRILAMEWDENRDGYVDEPEFTKGIFRALKSDKLTGGAEKFHDYFVEADSDGDGRCDGREMVMFGGFVLAADDADLRRPVARAQREQGAVASVS